MYLGDDPYDPSNLVLTPEQVEAGIEASRINRVKALPKPRRVIAGDFYPAAPRKWINKAGHLPGKTLHVALVIWLQATLKKSKTLSLSNKLLDKIGVKKWAKRAALLALEGAGLIQVEWKPGCNPIVTIKMDEDVPAHQQ